MNIKYMIPPEISEEVIYQDEDGTWMVQPPQKEGWLVEPRALYPQPTSSKGESEEEG